MTVVDDDLFHANLLPSSESMGKESLLNNREVEICNHSSPAYKRAVVQCESLSHGKTRIPLKCEDFVSVSHMVVYRFSRGVPQSSLQIFKSFVCQW